MMRPSMLLWMTGIVAAFLLLASRYLEFASGIPVVGTVSLSGDSRLSWAGDFRFFSSLGLMILAWALRLRWCKCFHLSSWLDGLVTGWLIAFGYGAFDWFLQQRELLSAMGVNSGEVSLKMGPGAFCFAGACVLWILHAVLGLPCTWSVSSRTPSAAS